MVQSNLSQHEEMNLGSSLQRELCSVKWVEPIYFGVFTILHVYERPALKVLCEL